MLRMNKLSMLIVFCFVCGIAFAVTVDKTAAIDNPCCYPIEGDQGWWDAANQVCSCTKPQPWCWQHPADPVCHCIYRCVE